MFHQTKNIIKRYTIFKNEPSGNSAIANYNIWNEKFINNINSRYELEKERMNKCKGRSIKII